MAQRGRPPHPGPLTPAEARVLEHVREGLPNAEIAVRLGISVNTVRYHVSNLLAKAGASSREELARWRPQTERKGWRWGWLLFGWKPVIVGLAVVGVVGVGALLFVPVPAMTNPHRRFPPPLPSLTPTSCGPRDTSTRASSWK